MELRYIDVIGYQISANASTRSQSAGDYDVELWLIRLYSTSCADYCRQDEVVRFNAASSCARPWDVVRLLTAAC